MPQLQQLNIRFDPVQDRLLLKLRAHDAGEMRLWLTRRFVKLLWRVLHPMLSELSGAAAQPHQAAQDAVMAFQNQQAVAKTDFTSAYRSDVKPTPLGSEPILAATIQRQSLNDRQAQIKLAPLTGPGIELTCDADTLHAICASLMAAVKKTDWDLDLKLFSAATPTPVANADGVIRH